MLSGSTTAAAPRRAGPFQRLLHLSRCMAHYSVSSGSHLCYSPCLVDQNLLPHARVRFFRVGSPGLSAACFETFVEHPADSYRNYASMTTREGSEDWFDDRMKIRSPRYRFYYLGNHLALTTLHQAQEREEAENVEDFRSAAGKQLTAHDDVITILDNVDLVSAWKTDLNTFQVKSDSGQTWTERKMVLASSVEDEPLDIAGYDDCWGKSIFYCLHCKGFEQRGTSAGILALGPLGVVQPALHIARQARALCKTVTLYTRVMSRGLNSWLRIWRQTRAESKEFILGSAGKGVTVRFEDGAEVTEEFLAHRTITKPRGPLADQLGLEWPASGDIKVSIPFRQTSVCGIFAAGDNSGMLKNVPKAISSGHVAGQMASTQLLAELPDQKPLFPL